MLVCRKRGDYSRKWKISAAFNVSQHDLEPLEIFRETLDCGSLRRAGNGGWYWEVNRLSGDQRPRGSVLRAVSSGRAEAARFRVVQERGRASEQIELERR